MSWWPWKSRLETRADSGYTETLVQLLAAQATGTDSVTTAYGTAALETAAGLVGRAFAAAEVNGPGPVVDALTPDVLALIGRSLIRRGEIVLAIDVEGGELILSPAASHDVLGRHPPSTWRYRVSLAGPDRTLTRDSLPGASVVHVMYARDVERPWRGLGPLGVALIAGRLSANVAAALADEAATPRGQLLPVPRAGGQDDTVSSLKGDLAALKGSLAVVEDASDQFATGSAAPGASANWQARRLGAAPPESLV